MRIFRIFRRLQWKLTFSYAIVTAISLVILQMGLIVYSVFFSGGFAPALAFAMGSAADESYSYLQQTPPDYEGLQRWLVDIKETSVSDDSFLNDAPLGEITFMAVVDPAGDVLAAYPPTAASQGSPLARQLEPPSADVLQTALDPSVAMDASRDNLEQFSARIEIGTLVAAVPLVDQQQGNRELLGVWLMRTNQTSSAGLQTITNVTLQLLPQVVITASIFAIIVGALFGFIASRSLTRRLGRLVKTASAWSKGDFSAVAADSSRDELGQLAQQLNRMSEEIQLLLRVRQDLATFEERNRLARDLHDSVKQQLFATGMQVGAARALLEQNDPTADARLADAERLAHAAQQELTMIIHELRPAALETKGLANALREYVGDWSRHSGIAAHISYQGQCELPLALEQTLFRVAQEALANVARHSNASRADVRVRWHKQGVELTVIDNGKGFNPVSVNGTGVGLQSMRERLEPLGGRLVVESSPGYGTSVIARIAY